MLHTNSHTTFPPLSPHRDLFKRVSVLEDVGAASPDDMHEAVDALQQCIKSNPAAEARFWRDIVSQAEMVLSFYDDLDAHVARMQAERAEQKTTE